MNHIIEGHNLLIKLEKVNFVSSGRFKLVLILGLRWHPDTRKIKVICHRKLWVPIEANILILLRISSVKTWISIVVHIWRISSSSSILISNLRYLLRLAHVALLILAVYHLLEEYLVDLDVAIVHNQVFSEEVFKSSAIDDVKLTVSFEAIN